MTTEIGTPQATGNPYVGPQAFRRGDPFYGRDRETADLLDLLIAERVVLLYSPSGAGKSSLIAAGLTHLLESEGFEVLPLVRVTHEAPPGSTLAGPPRNRYVLSTLLSLEESLPPEQQHHTAELDAKSVSEYIKQWADRDDRPGNEVLLFDQFEEVITADPNDHQAKAEFFADIGNALRDRKLWALFAIREDFLAELDPYAGYVPTRFANRYRLDLLGVDQALEAMIRPAADHGVDFQLAAAQRLVDDLRRIRVQRPAGVVEELGPTVEPVQLQVSCRQLWNRLDQTGRVIREQDVEALGDVDKALASYYAECVGAAAADTGVSERALRDWFEHELVTPQGIRGQVLFGPQDGAFSEHAVRMLTATHLVRAESRRGATWYELAHDRLIEPVNEDNAQWREEHLSYYERLAAWWDEQGRPEPALLTGTDLTGAEQWLGNNPESVSQLERDFVAASRRAADQAERERRANRRTRRWLVIAVIGCVLAAGFGTWGWLAERRAQNVANDLEIAALAGKARDALETDVDLGLLLAQQAVALPGGSPTDPDTQNALQIAVDQTPVVMVLRGHGPAVAAAYSTDGQRIVTHHSGGDLVVWDAASGEEIYVLPVPEGGLHKSARPIFSADGARVAAVTADGSIAIWPAGPNAGEPALVSAHDDGGSFAVAFSPDGSRIASAGLGGGLSVVDLAGRRVPGFDPAPSANVSINDLAWTPDGRSIVVGEAADVVSVWDAASGRRRGDLFQHTSDVVKLDLSPSGLAVASVSPGTTSINDLTTGEQLLHYDAGGLVAASFDASGSRLVVADEYGTATVFDTATGNTLRSQTAAGMSLRSVDVDPTDPGRAVVTSDGGDPALWDVAAVYTEVETTVVPLPSGDVLVTSYDGSANVWAADGPDRALAPLAGQTIEDASASRAGDLVAVARTSGAVEVWNLRTLEQELWASLSDGTGAWAVALSPDGRSVAVGGSDGRVVVWDLASGEQVTELQAHTDAIVGVAYGPDSKRLVSASWDGTAAIWDVGGSAQAQRLRLGTRASDAAWGAPGNVIAVAGEDGSVQFWDPQTASRVHEGTGRGHAKTVHDIAFDATGNRLVSASEDRSLIVWDATTGRDVQRIRQAIVPLRVAFAPDSRHIVVGDATNAPHVVYLNGEELLRVAMKQTTRTITRAECELFLRADAPCAQG